MKTYSIIKEGAFNRHDNRQLGLIYCYLRDMASMLEERKKEDLTVSERYIRTLLHDILTEIEKTAEGRGVDLHSVAYGMKEDP